MALRNLPIRRKVSAVILITSAAVMLLMLAAFFTYEYVVFRQAMTQRLSTLSEILASNSTAALAFENQDDAQEILSALKAEPNIVAGALYDEKGRLFSRYPASLPLEAVPASPAPDGHRFVASDLENFQAVTQRGRRLGTFYLKFNTGQVMQEWLHGSLQIALAAMALALLVSSLISRTLQQQISRPILALADTARAISGRHDYSVRAVKHGDDELGLLTDAFNQMLTQIQAQNEALRKNESELERRVLDRTSQLEAANGELEAFSYSVSHDLRAPLRHIDGFAGLLSGHARDALDEKSRRYLSTISEAARRMGRLIDDLLVFSRMNRSPMNLKTVDHTALLADVLRERHQEKSERPITWEIAPLPPVRADAPMLRQVWFNLIDNAVKYSGKSPEPRIVIGILTEKPGEQVFFVRDNGVGFDMAYVDKLFGVFQRLHGVTEFEGTGIGLANVRRIVSRHGGRTWAEGRPNDGATFYFSLPAPSSAATV